LKNLILLLFCTIILSCQTTKSKPVDPQKYGFLWEKKIGTGCMAAYHSESLLYLVSRERLGDVVQVTVYDPRTSIFVTVPLYYQDNAPCKNVNFTSEKMMGSGHLNFIESPEFRAIFDGYKEYPEKLKNAINAGPVYFRYDGKWNSKRSALNLDRAITSEIKDLDDVVSYLMQLSAENAGYMINARTSSIAANEEKIQNDRMQAKQARDRWENRMSTTLSIGDKVCTYDTNLFGYVENMNGNKIKVHVVGQVTQFVNMPGYFFSGMEGRYQYSRVEAIRWFDRVELGNCYFE